MCIQLPISRLSYLIGGNSTLSGNGRIPKLIWEKQFDQFDNLLRDLVSAEWPEISRDDLWYYLLDLAYVELQPDLFRYLFPLCLAVWRDDLMQNAGSEIGGIDLYKSLLEGDVLKRMATVDERAAIYRFFVDGMLERLEMERLCSDTASQFRNWIGALNALGYVAPVIPTIWQEWWGKFTSPGSAYSAILYGSGFIYAEAQLLALESGGGINLAPELTFCDTVIYQHVWLEENLSFLKDTLSVPYIQDKMVEAADFLRNEPEHEIAKLVAADALTKGEVIQLRLEDLFGLLSVSSDDRSYSW